MTLSGRQKLLFVLCILVSLGISIIWAFRQEFGEPAREQSQEEDQGGPLVAVKIGKIQRATLHGYVVAYGTVEPEPASEDKPPAGSRVAAPLAGIIAEVNCREGQRVKRGETLFRLDRRVADTLVEKAKVALQFAQKNYERKKTLQRTNDVSQKLYEEASHQFDAARNDLATALAQRSLLTIEAPLSGTLVKVNPRPGEAVDLNAVLAELIDLDRLVVNASVPSTEANGLKIGQPVEIVTGRIASGKNVASPPIHQGTLSFIGSQVNPRTDTVVIRSSLLGSSGFRPGQFVSVRILAEERRNRLAVPVESVVMEDGKSVIALVQDGKAVRKPVTVHLRDGDLLEIEGDGLQEGMTVVTAGAYGLPMETRIRVIGE